MNTILAYGKKKINIKPHTDACKWWQAEAGTENSLVPELKMMLIIISVTT